MPLGPDVFEIANGMVVVHAMTRSVRDSAALLDATSGPELGDAYWSPPRKRPFLAEVGRPPGRLKVAVTFQGIYLWDVVYHVATRETLGSIEG